MDGEEQYDVSVLCSACLCELRTDIERQEHYTSEWHIYNIKRKTADLPPIPYQLFHEKFQYVQKMQQDEKSRQGKVVCPITAREFKTQGAYDHFRGTKEYARQYERFVKKQETEQLNAQQGIVTEVKAFNKHKIEYILPSPEDDLLNENDLALLEQDRMDEETEAKAAAEAEAQEAASQTEASTTAVTPSTEMTDETVTMDDNEEEIELQEGQIAIPLKHSLFDNVGPFKCARSSYMYMAKKYNFRIPYQEFLIDFEGLMEYLGAKIGIGHMCLNCNKRFETTMGCQAHMVAHSHCNFTLEALQKGNDDGDGATDDFVFDYFDFSHNFVDNTYTDEELKQRQMSRLRTLLALGIKTIREITIQEAKGEDVLSTVLTIPTQHDIQLTGLSDDGNIKLSDGSEILSRKTKRENDVKKTLAYYERKNQIALEHKLANRSVMTPEKEEALHELKHFQKYWRQQAVRVGLRQNYILKEYFRKQNQQNN